MPHAPPQPTTSPCPGCGRPVEHSALLCTHCGQHIRAGVQLDTKLAKPEYTAPPPIPPIAPGPARFRQAPVDEHGRRLLYKSIAMIPLCAMIVVAWKWGEDGPQEAGHDLTRLGISIAVAWGICILEAITFLEVGVGIIQTALGIAAALAAGDLTQHILHYIPLAILPIIGGCIVCLFWLADLLDIDYSDATFLALAIYLAKVILTWTLFRTMFAPQ